LGQGSPKRNMAIAQAKARDPQGTPVSLNAIYSMVTASRPISRATSSSWTESWSSTARARRARHSSSLIAGNSLGTIDGTRLMKSVWGLCIEHLKGIGTYEASRQNKSFWRLFAAGIDLLCCTKP
jgi:hypothetical protein